MYSKVLLLLACIIAVTEQARDVRCFPPVNFYSTHGCVQDSTSQNPNYDCLGGHFVRTAGIGMPCETDQDCIHNMEPNEWCNSERNGYQWTTAGCHCDMKLKSCIVQRFDKSYNEIQWAFCTPRNRFKCEVLDHCSPPKH